MNEVICFWNIVGLPDNSKVVECMILILKYNKILNNNINIINSVFYI